MQSNDLIKNSSAPIVPPPDLIHARTRDIEPRQKHRFDAVLFSSGQEGPVTG